MCETRFQIFVLVTSVGSEARYQGSITTRWLLTVWPWHTWVCFYRTEKVPQLPQRVVVKLNRASNKRCLTQPMVRHRHRPRFTFLKDQALQPCFTHMNMNQHWSQVYYQYSDTIYSKIYLKCILAHWQVHEKLKHHMKLLNYFLCSTKNGTDPEPFYMQKKVHSSHAIDAWAMGVQPSHGWEGLLSSKIFHNSSCH